MQTPELITEKPRQSNRQSAIVATVIISESELIQALPDYQPEDEINKPQQFKQLLHGLGMDTTQAYVRQDNLKHRNRLNQVVHCNRWLGEERLDKQWINSGYASVEAKDKASGSFMLESLYREKMHTTDAQEYLESKDRYTKVDKSAWE